MNDYIVPDLKGAAEKLEQANTAIKAAIIALRRPDGSATLWTFADKLGEVAQHFREGRMLVGLRVPLLDAKAGARVLGRSKSLKKLEALAKARAVLAEKRRLNVERSTIRRRVARHTIPSR